MKKSLIIVIVVALLGAGGWLVTRDRSKTESQNSSNPASNVQTSSDVKRFSNDSFSFEYPKDWVPEKEEGQTVFHSTDFKQTEVTGDYERNEMVNQISAGYKLTVKILATDTPNKTIQDLTNFIIEEEKSLGGGTHKAITIDGNPTLLVNNKHSTQSLYAIIFHEHAGIRVHVQLDAKDDSSSETTALFDKILASFKVN